MKQGGLGKGLGALLNTVHLDERPRVLEIPVDEISPNPHQPRVDFNEERLDELAQSIKSRGVLHPIIIRKGGDKGYQIVAGERRWRAAIKAGFGSITSIIREADEEQMMEYAIIENLQREDLNPIEEGIAFQALLDKFKISHDELGTIVGRSRSAIANTIRLLKLPPVIKKHIQEGRLSMGHARALLPLEDATKMRKLANGIVKKGMTVRAVEEAVKQHISGVATGKRKSAKQSDPFLLNAAMQLSEKLGTKTQILGSQNKGKIVIEYYSEDDCRRIVEEITERH